MADSYYGAHDLKGDVEANKDEDVIVRIDNIHKTYLLGIEGVPALRGVSLSIKRGEFLVVFGLSGGGKTTLMNIIGTIDTPTKGELVLGGYRINSSTTDDVLSFLRLKKIGFVFQTFNLLSSLTALENVEMPMILAGDLSADQRRRRATDLLNSVGMGARLDHLPSQLSGGEQQRVTIARAMANKPDLLLLDEPTGDLDSNNTCIVMKLLLELNQKQGITLVMVTHDVGLKNFADRVIWMRDGKIQSVERISAATKQARLEQLDAEHQGALKGAKEKRPEFKNTVLRRPTDYDTHPHFAPRDAEKFDFAAAQKLTQAEFEEATRLRPLRRGDDLDDLSKSTV